MITGALLILTAEQAFAHAHLIAFPHQILAQTILVPCATLSGLVGLITLCWGYATERKSP